MVDVLTTRYRIGSFEDDTPLRDLPPNVRVIRAWSPNYPSTSAPAMSAGTTRPDVRMRARRLVRDALLRWVLIPDSEMPWIPFAWRSGHRELSRQRYDSILSSGPPHSAHVVASLLRRSFRVRWVADTPDPWSGNPYWPRGTTRDGIDRWLERRVLRGAAAIVTPVPTLTDRLRMTVGTDARFDTIPNGYDEREFERAVPIRRAGLHMVHVGSFYGDRRPDTLLSGLERALATRPALRGRVFMTLTGYADPHARAAIASAARRLDDAVIYRPFTQRDQALGLMLGADVLVLITDAAAAGRELVPLKTYEYLRADRPILALVPPGAVRSLLERTGGALLVAPGDAGEVAAAIVRLLDGSVDLPRRDAELVASFEAERLTRRLADLLSGASPA